MQAALDRMPSPRTLVRRTAGPILGLVFIAAAYSKAVDPRETIRAFEWALRGGETVGVLAASMLAGAEFVLGACLLIRVSERFVLGAAFLALLMFTGWLVYLAVAGVDIACGCGIGATWLEHGEARTTSIARNAALLTLAAFGVAARPWSGVDRLRKRIVARSA